MKAQLTARGLISLQIWDTAGQERFRSIPRYDFISDFLEIRNSRLLGFRFLTIMLCLENHATLLIYKNISVNKF